MLGVNRVKTNNLYCTKCLKPIQKGDTAYFDMSDDKKTFNGAYHIDCGPSKPKVEISNELRPTPRTSSVKIEKELW